MGKMPSQSTWGELHWYCEDCGVDGHAVGVPDSCPNCGSVNTSVVDYGEES